MSQFMSGSPEGDDQLPSFMDQKPKAQQQASATAGPSQTSSTPPNRLSTQSPRPKAPSHSHSHAHGSPGHQNCASIHHHAHGHSQSQSARTWSTTSSSNLSVPGSGHEPPSRSMSRTPSHEYRETLDAKSRDLEDGSRIINQYKIMDLIGRGAYGTVRKAILTDDPSVQFAVKEFGKTRLRKTHRAANFRKAGRGRGPQVRAGLDRKDAGNRSEPTRNDDGNKDDEDELKDPLTLIRHEIAILKKLHHPHVVKLYEVLDDPSKDSLYMVFEYCPDGRVIDVKLNESVEPLPEDVARLYFVQVLMGIEYLHENEIVHRDIKPDNILLSEDRKSCKIVDFGVSEIFAKPGDDTMQKSVGSPAFMSPELCTAGHAEYHGKSDDIWSFGVTLYCMVVGHLPFNKDNFYEMYESIKNDEPEYPDHLSDDLKDLLQKMLAKDPEKRITVPEMREHPWTKSVEEGILLSKKDNLETVVDEITEEDLDCAICKITNIFTFARAISRFKKGGSMQRARREASRSTSGGSNPDTNWFPPSTPSRSNTMDSGKSSLPEVSPITEEPESQSPIEDKRSKPAQPTVDTSQREGGGRAAVQELEKAAAYMFESPQMHTFELPSEEPDGNGPLQRNRSGPISTLHKPAPGEETNAPPPVITMDSPRSASPQMMASPVSDSAAGGAEEGEESGQQSATTSGQSGAADYSEDTPKPDEALAADLASMMSKRERNGGAERRDQVQVQQQSTGAEPETEPRRVKTVEERASELGHKSKAKAKPQVKLLPDQPTFKSPYVETIKTPPGASELYRQKGKVETQGAQGDAENPYFAAAGGQGKQDEMDQDGEEEKGKRQPASY